MTVIVNTEISPLSNLLREYAEKNVDWDMESQMGSPIHKNWLDLACPLLYCVEIC